MGRGKSEMPFASASLVALTIRALHSLDISLLPPYAREPDYFANATTGAQSKADVLAHAYKQGGAIPLLGVGAFLEDMVELPSMRVLMNSVDTGVLANKWMRLEVFHHSAHRVAINSQASRTWNCTRRWKGDTPPSDPENLLICGIMLGLLNLFGCRNITGSIGSIYLNDGTQKTNPVFPQGDTLSWQIHWSGASKKPLASTPDLTTPDHSDISRAIADPSDQLLHLFKRDMGRVWKVGGAASAIARAPRSLQREIKDAGHTFSSLVRKARSQEACQLLSETEMSLSNIGYSCGYSDQAHFQRDFRRAVNMTPLQYRQLDGREGAVRLK